MSFESGAGSSKKKIDKLKIAIVDTSDALEAQARDIAEERLTASKEELKGIKGIFSKIWKHNLAREYYRQKEIAKGKLEITESGNLYVGEGATQEIHTQAMHAVINRFVEEYEEVIHTDVGETRRKVGVENAQDVELNRSVRELVRAYAANELDDEAFNAERSRVIAYATGLTGTELAQAVNHTDNILEVARQARSAVEHGASLDEIDQEIEIVIGKAKTGVRTEAQFNTVDRIAKKMQSTWVGKFVNETSIASGVAIAYATTIGLSQRLASSKAFAWGTFGASALVGGAVAAMRESVQVEEERKQHARQRAKGVEIAPDSERRTEMESLIYASVPAQSLTETLSNIPEVIDSPEVFMSLMNTLAEAEMRIRLSDREKIDLLSYTDFKSVEAERLSLDIARAKAKVALTTMAASHADFLPPEQTFAQFYDSLLDTKSAMLRGGDEGMEAKDKLFKKMKRRKVAGAAAKAVLTGLTIGAVAEEGVAFMLDSREGVLEHALGAQGPHRAEGVTVFEGLRRFMDEGASLGRVVENSILPNGAHVALPEGVQIIPNPLNVNEATFVKDGEVFSQKIIFENGVLTKASEDFLATHEISVTKNIVQLSGETPASVDPRTFADSHPELFNKIQRKFWYDNNTTLFDKNELKLHWGGVKGTGVDQSGNYVFNIGKMTGDGSIHGSTSIDAPGVMKQQPGLKLLLSLSKETQSSVVEVPIDAQGNAVIDPQSTIGKMFFKNEGGKLTFIGKFAEIAHEAGVSKSGAKQFEILATHTGAGVDSVPTGNTIDPYTVSRFGVTDTEPFIDPMFVPLFGRTPLEEMRVRKNEEYHTKSKNGKDEFVVPMPYYYAGSGFEYSAEQANLHEQDRSPRLKENPDVTLDESLEINEYLERQEVDYKKYLKEVAAEFGPITNTCRVSVCIPVADHQEGGNIYNSLKNYTNQSADPETFELVLFTNHPETDKKGKPIAPDNTLEEIARFKKDFPRMNVRVCSRVIPVENAKIGYIRKVMNDAVLMRQKNRTKGSPELIMISNDADNKGIATEYIENFIYQFDRNPDVDSFVGQLDWDLEAYVKNPLIHVGTRMILYLSAQSRSNGWHFESSGANTAFKASIYAAVGGYDTNLKGGEDSDLGARIASARVRAQKKESIGYAGTRVSRLFTSARRAEMVMEKYGMSPREQWDKGFSAFDDDVRKVNWQNKGLVNFDNPNEVAELVKGIEDVINRTIKRGNQWGETVQHPMVKRSLGWLGITYSIVDDSTIKIIDASKLVKGLKAYQTEGFKIRDRKINGTNTTQNPAERTEKEEDVNVPVSVKADDEPSAPNNQTQASTTTSNPTSQSSATFNTGTQAPSQPEASADEKIERRKENEAEEFSVEMEQAQKGDWIEQKSSFWTKYVTDKVSGKTSEYTEKMNTLTEANEAALQKMYDAEALLVAQGVWVPEKSPLNFFDPTAQTSPTVGMRKRELFLKLTRLNIERLTKLQELADTETMRSMDEIFEAEKQLIEKRTWKRDESKLREVLQKVGQSLKIQVRAGELLRSLYLYESGIISEKIRAQIEPAFTQEVISAKAGTWAQIVSFFNSIKQDPDFRLVSNDIRQEISEKVLELDRINRNAVLRFRFGSQRAFTNQQRNRNEAQVAPESDAEKAMRILKLSKIVTLKEAKAAYRRYANLNSPDKHPNASEAEKKKLNDNLTELNRTWAILEQELTAKEANKS